MQLLILLPRALASLGIAYTLFVLWMAAGLIAVLLLSLTLNAGLTLARHGDRPLEDWPLLRRFLR